MSDRDQPAEQPSRTPEEWITEFVRRAEGNPVRAHELARGMIQAGLKTMGFQFYVLLLSNLPGAAMPPLADELTLDFMLEARSEDHLEQLIRERTDARENPNLVSQVREQVQVAAVTAVVEAVNREIERYQQQHGGGAHGPTR